jgi:hypothetical protein
MHCVVYQTCYRAVKSWLGETAIQSIEMEEMGHVANTVSAIRDLIVG